MRKITKDAVRAFRNHESFNGGNTKVVIGVQTSKVTQVSMFLHGNLIATNYHDGEVGFFIRNAGWESNTTKERLNGFPNVSIYQKNYVWYLNDEAWDGSMTKIY